MMEELLSRFGTPALILAFAAVVWDRVRRHETGIAKLWTRGDAHESRISTLEGINEGEHRR